MRVNRTHLMLVIMLMSGLSTLVTGCSGRQDNAPALQASTTVGTEIDDTVVTTKVKSALLSDPDIKSFDLKVETRKGLVQLSGYVDNQTQIERAVTATRGVEGAAARIAIDACLRIANLDNDVFMGIPVMLSEVAFC